MPRQPAPAYNTLNRCVAEVLAGVTRAKWSGWQAEVVAEATEQLATGEESWDVAESLRAEAAYHASGGSPEMLLRSMVWVTYADLIDEESDAAAYAERATNPSPSQECDR